MSDYSNLERKLAWCREHIPHFAEMEQRKLAAAEHEKRVKEELGYERLRTGNS